MAGNTIQAMIEYDLTMSLDIELWGISYGSPDPVLLASGTGEEIDGNKIKRYAEWTADSSPWQCYIRIAPETGIIGGYALTIQTRGPELEPAPQENREVVRHILFIYPLSLILIQEYLRQSLQEGISIPGGLGIRRGHIGVR